MNDQIEVGTLADSVSSGGGGRAGVEEAIR